MFSQLIGHEKLHLKRREETHYHSGSTRHNIGQTLSYYKRIFRCHKISKNLVLILGP